jgi:hypothetical protein
MVEFYEFTYTLVAILISWSMYMSLYGKPSPFRSWAENSFIGFSMGLGLVVTFFYVLRIGWEPLFRGNLFPALGIALGLLTLFRLFPKYSYIARVPIAISIGTNLAISLRTTIFTGFIEQIKATIVPFWVSGDLYTSLLNTVVSISVVLILSFFLYSIELKGPWRYASKAGEYALYIALGAVFAQTFMGRLGLLVGYLQSISDPSWKIPYTLAFLAFVLAGTVIMDRYGILEKYS